MSLLVASHLTQHFTVYQSRPGLLGAMRALVGGRIKKVIHALEDFSFTLHAGEIVGLIGPNGAGKSTFVKLATGILPPTSGALQVFGLEPFRHRARIAQSYGVVFGQRSQLWWNLPAREAFQALARIYALDLAAAQVQIDYLTEVMDLKDFMATPVRQLSLGQRVRCDVAAALIHQPKLIFLDEPTVGVDVVAKERLRGFIRRVNQECGVTILLTSHDMVDIERLCQRVVVIDKGRLAYEGPLEALRKRITTERQLVLDLKGEPERLRVSAGEVIQRDGARVVIRFDAQAHSAMEILAQVAETCEVSDFSIREMPIDQVIAQIYHQNASQPVPDTPENLASANVC